MPRPVEMVWLCSHTRNTITVDGVTLLPYTCNGFPITTVDEQAIADLVASGELYVRSGYFEGQQDPDACPPFGSLRDAMICAVATALKTDVSNLSEADVFVIDDQITAGLLTGFDGVAKTVAAVKAARKAA